MKFPWKFRSTFAKSEISMENLWTKFQFQKLRIYINYSEYYANRVVFRFKLSY